MLISGFSWTSCDKETSRAPKNLTFNDYVDLDGLPKIWAYFMTWYSLKAYIISASCITGVCVLCGILSALVVDDKVCGVVTCCILSIIGGLVWCVPVLIALVLIVLVAGIIFGIYKMV